MRFKTERERGGGQVNKGRASFYARSGMGKQQKKKKKKEDCVAEQIKMERQRKSLNTLNNKREDKKEQKLTKNQQER